MKVYKLTDQFMRAHGGFQWELKRTYTASGRGPLCTSGWLHAYVHPLLAVLHNPIHAAYPQPRVFEATTGRGRLLRDGAMKLGATSLRLTRELPLPILTMEHRIRYAIGCALSCQQSQDFIDWATRWVDGVDRSAEAAGGAAEAAWAAAEAAWAREAEAEAREAEAAAARAARAAAAGDLPRIAEWAITSCPLPQRLEREGIK